MSWSLGETRALAVKAARGAGMSWGMAEEAGFAVYWLQAHEAPGVQALAQYLSWRATPECETMPVWVDVDQYDPSATFCPLELGAALLDAAEGMAARLGRVRQPLLLAPFIAASTPSDMRRLIWADTEILVSQQSLAMTTRCGSLLIEQAECRVESGGEGVQSSAAVSRVSETEAAPIAQLEDFAARTYAPATEQSRIAGAGAGLSDND